MSFGAFECQICNVRCDTEQQLRIHETGKKHRSKCLRQDLNVFGPESSVIKATISTPRQITPASSPIKRTDLASTHVDSFPGVFTTITPGGGSQPNGNSPSGYHCSICDTHMNSPEQYAAHLKGQKHQKKSKSASSALNAVQAGNGGVILNGFLQHSSPASSPVGASVNRYGPASQASGFVGRECNLQVVSEPTQKFARIFKRSCREHLLPVWPGVTFSNEQAEVLVASSLCEDDCFALLNNDADGWFRVGIHLVIALLSVNRATQPSWPTTTAVWIAPTLKAGPPVELFTSVTLPPVSQDTTGGPKIRVLLSGFASTPTQEHDLLITDPEYFTGHYRSILLDQDKVCCIIIQDASKLSANFRLCDLVRQYIGHLRRPEERAKIICLSEEPLPPGSLFALFRPLGTLSQY
ncbi:unnamed protein product [Calicophoron daubneyi]|uniref:C2H2-type domain-containing protein n=1 Tax=Calicophoron daubneyi TaxID=300641 RepID=A0AAV2T9M8_CALDB